ncbi:D-alanine--D-alanine ligase family protein [Nocardioides antri]|uniref:D-alanine--D-alanine ligase n=1 Tax=Nocardioides antri TaxID=2607659 RepID=A0A5B1M1X5_9ACTN|nr:D-alanine--D-alanine ligase family protein [Nocardioides antri]KAA1427145.1 D-alanine--D-alanine ligase [Nocardioides antri]
MSTKPGRRPRVAVIGGGANSEHDVSLASATAVRAALPAASYDVVPLTIPRSGGWRDGNDRPLGLLGAAAVLSSCDVVFPVVHGCGGEDGTIAALCALAGLPCVGSPAATGATAMDKQLTKLVAASVGIAVAAGAVLTTADAADHVWAGPVVVKPVTAGSSQGVSLVEHPDELERAVKEAFAHGDRVLVEQVVHGREIDVAVLGTADGSREVPPPLEIVGPGVFDYATKYGGAADLRVPADVTSGERAQLTDAAVRMYDALGCRGLARIDFFLTADGPVLLEVNTMPGLTEHSQAPRMFAAAGVPYADLLDRMVRDALG